MLRCNGVDRGCNITLLRKQANVRVVFYCKKVWRTFLNEGKQMMAQKAGASSARQTTWKSIDWPHVEKQVEKLQMRIAKATMKKRFGKVKSLNPNRYVASTFQRRTANKGLLVFQP